MFGSIISQLFCTLRVTVTTAKVQTVRWIRFTVKHAAKQTLTIPVKNRFQRFLAYGRKLQTEL